MPLSRPSLSRRSRFLLAVAALVAVAPAVPADAHHSFAMFDRAKNVVLTGTVREFQYNNPHCFIQLVVPGKGGATEEWSIEMGPPAHLVTDGWNRNTVKPGDKITVHIYPLRAGGSGGEFISATGAGGKKL